jgi:hypothetical protein
MIRTLWTLLLAGACLSHAQTNSLATRQTSLVLQAGRAAPRMVSLRTSGSQVWANRGAEKLIAFVESDGHSLPLHWTLDAAANHADATSVTYVYTNASPRLRLSWTWEARAQSGPIEHSITIENLSSADVWLPLQPSFAFDFQISSGDPLRYGYVDKGMGKPAEVGTHLDALRAGDRWHGDSSTYARNQDPREIIPWFMVERANPSQDGWYAGIEFSGRTRLTLQRTTASLRGAVGLNPDPGPFRTRLRPNETFHTPTIFIGAFRDGMDGLGNVLRPWVRQVLNNPLTWKNPAYPPLVNNSWGSGMQIDETIAHRMLRDSAELGVELFALDAGWFRGVGDWYPSPEKFPHGLAPIAAEAHQRGLRFGIWVDWAQAGIDTEPGALNVNNPATRDWLVADTPPGWKPDEFVGRTTDLGYPPAKAYAEKEVERMINSYHLDMLEHDGYLVAKNCARTDHPHAPAQPPQMSTVSGNGIDMPDNGNSTDVSYHAVRAYYDIYAQARVKHPGLIFEICNDGGRMVDFGSAAHGDYFSITDSYDPLSNRQAFYDASHLLPPAMLEAYVQKWPVPHIDNFRYMLRSGMMGMLTIMQDTNAWTPEQHAAAKAELALYREKLRPLLRDADLYHVSPRPDGLHWDGLEYVDQQRNRGVLYVFRGSSSEETKHTFRLAGLRPEVTYQLHFQDNRSEDRSITGKELLTTGLSVTLPTPLSSELVFFRTNPTDKLGSPTGHKATEPSPAGTAENYSPRPTQPQRKTTAPYLVIPTGAKRSGGICSAPLPTTNQPIHPPRGIAGCPPLTREPISKPARTGSNQKRKYSPVDQQSIREPH